MPLPKQSQLFVQAMMDVGAVTAKRTAKLYNDCGQMAAEAGGTAKSVSADGTGLDVTADTINNALSIVGLALRTAYSPWEKTTFWGLANVSSDDAVKLGTGMSPLHVAFFFALLDELMQSDMPGEMSLVDMQNAGLEHKLKVNDAGRLIMKLNREGWLKIISKQRKDNHAGQKKVTYGARSLLEIPTVRAAVLSMKGNVTVAEASSDEEEGEDADMNDGDSDGEGDENGNNDNDDDGDDDDDDDEEPEEPVRKRRRSARGARSTRSTRSS